MSIAPYITEHAEELNYTMISEPNIFNLPAASPEFAASHHSASDDAISAGDANAKVQKLFQDFLTDLEARIDHGSGLKTRIFQADNPLGSDEITTQAAADSDEVTAALPVISDLSEKNNIPLEPRVSGRSNANISDPEQVIPTQSPQTDIESQAAANADKHTPTIAMALKQTEGTGESMTVTDPLDTGKHTPESGKDLPPRLNEAITTAKPQLHAMDSASHVSPRSAANDTEDARDTTRMQQASTQQGGMNSSAVFDELAKQSDPKIKVQHAAAEFFLNNAGTDAPDLGKSTPPASSAPAGNAANSISALQSALTARETTETHTTLQSQVMAGSKQWIDEIGGQVRWLGKMQISSAEIKLNPAELGSLEIQITTTDDKTSVSIQAASNATKELLEAALPKLRELLQNSGLQLTDSSVSHKDSSSQSGNGFSHNGAPGRESVNTLHDAHDTDAKPGEHILATSGIKQNASQVDYYV